MPAWPAYARCLADGYESGQDADVERTPFDDGMVRQAKRYTAAMRVRRVTALLGSDADYLRFQAWARSHAHVLFDWLDPEDGTARRVRVRGGTGAIAYRARVGPSLARRWEATLELEGPSTP